MKKVVTVLLAGMLLVMSMGVLSSFAAETLTITLQDNADKVSVSGAAEIKESDTYIPQKLLYLSHPESGTAGTANQAVVTFTSPVAGKVTLKATLGCPDVTNGAGRSAYQLAYKMNNGQFADWQLDPNGNKLSDSKTDFQLTELSLEINVVQGENKLYLYENNNNGAAWRIDITKFVFDFTLVDGSNVPDVDTAGFFGKDKMVNHPVGWWINPPVENGYFAIRFNALYGFKQFIYKSHGGENAYTIEHALYKWNTDEATTLKGTPVFTKSVTETSNKDITLDFGKTIAKGEYVLIIQYAATQPSSSDNHFVVSYAEADPNAPIEMKCNGNLNPDEFLNANPDAKLTLNAKIIFVAPQGTTKLFGALGAGGNDTTDGSPATADASSIVFVSIVMLALAAVVLKKRSFA